MGDVEPGRVDALVAVNPAEDVARIVEDLVILRSRWSGSAGILGACAANCRTGLTACWLVAVRASGLSSSSGRGVAGQYRFPLAMTAPWWVPLGPRSCGCGSWTSCARAPKLSPSA
jgi:hypothetical protein